MVKLWPSLLMSLTLALFISQTASASINDDEMEEPTALAYTSLAVQPVTVRSAMLDSLKFYSPYIAGQVAITANGIWNSWITGKLGGAALQAEALTLTYEFLIMGTWMGALRANGIIAGQLYHHGDGSMTVEERARALSNLNKTATILTTLYGAGAMLMFWQSGNIIKSIGLVSDAAIIQQINDYFVGFMWGTIPTLLLFGDELFCLGVRDAKPAGIFAGFYAAIASIMAYPLAMGTWGASRYDINGVGVAMATGASIAWAGMRIYYNLSNAFPYRDLNLINPFTLKLSAFRIYLKYAIPLGLTNSVGLVTGFISSQIITGVSNKAAAAYSAATAYATQLEVTLLALSSAFSAQIANFDPRVTVLPTSVNGEPNQERLTALKRYAKVSVASSVGLSLVLTGLPLLWPEPFIKFFAGPQTPDVLDLSKKFLWFVSGQSILNNFSNAVEGILHGLKDIAVPFVIDIASDGASLGALILVAKYAQDPMWLASTGTVVAALTAVAYSARTGVFMKNITKSAIQKVQASGSRLTNCWRSFTNWLYEETPLEEAFQ